MGPMRQVSSFRVESSSSVCWGRRWSAVEARVIVLHCRHREKVSRVVASLVSFARIRGIAGERQSVRSRWTQWTSAQWRERSGTCSRSTLVAEAMTRSKQPRQPDRGDPQRPRRGFRRLQSSGSDPGRTGDLGFAKARRQATMPVARRSDGLLRKPTRPVDCLSC